MKFLDIKRVLVLVRYSANSVTINKDLFYLTHSLNVCQMLTKYPALSVDVLQCAWETLLLLKGKGE